MSNTDYSRLRIGIAGAGLMGRWHAKTAKRLGAKLISILDLEPARAKRLSGELGSGSEIYTNIDDMLSRARLDIIHICTPLISHYPIANHAINAGVHMIVEKPMAASVQETEMLLDASSREGVKLCPVHQFGFQSGVQDAIAELDSLGDLLGLRFTAGSAGGEDLSSGALDDIIADIIPHPLSVLQRLRPGITLDASQWSGVHSRDGELQIIGNADGVSISIYVSMNARPTRCEMELFCENGRIYLNLFHGYAIIERGGVSRIQKVIQPFRYALKELFVAGWNITKRGLTWDFAYPGLTRLIEDFYKAVTTSEALPVSAADALAIAVVRDDITRRHLPGVSTNASPSQNQDPDVLK
jgi:predicted dehydrogenase